MKNIGNVNEIKEHLDGMYPTEELKIAIDIDNSNQSIDKKVSARLYASFLHNQMVEECKRLLTLVDDPESIIFLNDQLDNWLDGKIIHARVAENLAIDSIVK